MGFEFVKEFIHEFEEGGEVGLVGGSFETEVDEVALLTPFFAVGVENIIPENGAGYERS